MSDFPLGPGGLLFVCLYLCFMLAVGYVSRRKRLTESLSEFYLAGKNLGWFVLLLTLYATQYSGNTLLGYPGEAYRLGFAWVMSVGFMMSIVVVYLLYAPQLNRLAKQHDFITPGDWLDHRFGSASLSFFANLVLVIAIANFLLAQLMAMGHVVTGLTGGMVPYWTGVVGLAFIIIIYETLGGMRAVAWTDCVQGLILLVGLLGLLLTVFATRQDWSELTAWIVEHQPEKTTVPSWAVCRTWISTLLLVGFSGAVYPQAIQRIYAARNPGSLKRSLSVMVFMPLLSTLVMFFIGILGIQHFSGLKQIGADQVMPMLLAEWTGRSTLMYVLVVMVVTGMLAAIMSTADSVLLSLSSMISKDFLGKTVLKTASEEKLTKVGKGISWLVMFILVVIALSPRITLWGLTELKMEILSQAAPAIILGVMWPRLASRAATTGIVVGTLIAVGLTLAGYDRVWGFHSGLIGLAVNVGVCLAGSVVRGIDSQ